MIPQSPLIDAYRFSLHHPNRNLPTRWRLVFHPPAQFGQYRPGRIFL